MKNLTLCAALVLIAVWVSNAQTVPLAITQYLDANHSGWSRAPGPCEKDSWVLTGDFDGDGQADYVVRFMTGTTAATTRLNLVAFFDRNGTLVPEPFYGEPNTDEVSRSATAIIKKGTTVSIGLGAEDEGPNIRLKDDAVVQYICETDASITFVYNNGRLKNIQEIPLEKSPISQTVPVPAAKDPAPLISTDPASLPNLNGQWVFKNQDGSRSTHNPWQLTQTAEKLVMTIKEAAGGADSILTGKVKKDSLIIDFQGSGTIEQGGNVIRFRAGNYLVKDGYAGPIGTGSGIPLLEQNCLNLAQGKVAWNRAGNTRWETFDLQKLCLATDNPEATINCFKSELKKQDDPAKNIQMCSEIYKNSSQSLKDQKITKIELVSPGKIEPGPEPIPPSIAASRLADEVLTAQNKYRAEVGVAPLKWSEALAQSAQVWAKHLSEIRRMQHSTSNLGENIWAGSTGHFSYAKMVGGWGDERSYFTRGIYPNVSSTGNSLSVGHYTQMVWKDTTEVGCGIASDGVFDYLVCQYNPRGNIGGKTVF